VGALDCTDWTQADAGVQYPSGVEGMLQKLHCPSPGRSYVG